MQKSSMALAASVTSYHAVAGELNPYQALKLIVIFTTLATLLPFLLQLHHDYLAFIALGPGGTPPTFAGFLRIKILSLFALKEPCKPAPIPPALAGSSGYLVDLRKRSLSRPCTRGIAPHRQVTQKADPKTYDRLATGIKDLSASNPHLVVRTSCFEKHSTGLFSVCPAERTCAGEVCHSHPSDGSMHLTLHPADAKKVLEAGWGERHPLARGGWFERFVPAGFMMVYAPRDEAEVDTVLEIVRAAAWFVGGGEGVAGLVEVRRDSGYASGEEKTVEVRKRGCQDAGCCGESC